MAAIPRESFAQATVLIIGDLMLDRYISGEVHRISPEAPVPVLTVGGERATAGGAANVALNVCGLGGRVSVAGVVGRDAAAKRLFEILSRDGIDTAGVITDRNRPTTCKTRVVCGTQQIVRLDEEVCEEIPAGVRAQVLAQVDAKLAREGIGAVVLSDYSKGVLGPDLTTALIKRSAAKGVPVLVDPKKTDYSIYRQATCITPNLKEFQAALQWAGLAPGDPAGSGPRLRERLQCQMLLITQGAGGMTLVTANQALHLPALAEEVFDVSGAGDTVIATLATAMGCGIPPAPAAALANLAASIVVRKLGTAPILWSDLEKHLLEKSRPEGFGPIGLAERAIEKRLPVS